MVNTEASSSSNEFDRSKRNSEGSIRSRSAGRIPKSWIIAALIFYIASVVTVGLLAGLLPRRTQHITILATPTPGTTTTTTAPPGPPACVEDECNLRLQSNLTVHTYELEYRYNGTEQTTVQGKVTIDFTLHQPIRQLIYHGKRLLDLQGPEIQENNVSRAVSMSLHTPNDYITLRLTTNSSFEPNSYKLTQQFTVNLTDGIVGFYQNIFKDGDGITQKLLSTQFQPTDARKAFPCFDEPQLKARFRISIIHPNTTIARANFPIISEEALIDGLIQTKFNETFLMSTYLAAWAILPGTYGNRMDSSNTTTVWARREPTLKGHTEFALEVALRSFPFFTNYFNTNEPITPKTDLLSVPDYTGGAMENWGLVTFREDRIIFDEKIASTHQKQQLAETMAHEIAHYWFGNYVTCKWWDDLWLNEAMATWLSYKPLEATYTDWNVTQQVLTEKVIPVMWDDAKPSSHPIVVKNVTSAAEITSLFDSITYSKGASILRMLEHIVGSGRFQENLRVYLTSNKFSVGDPNTFYNGLFDDTSGEDFMRNWLEEPNFPLLKVNLSVENNETKVIFTQSRFIISNVLNTSGLNETYRWKIFTDCVLGDQSESNTMMIPLRLETEEEIRNFSGTYSWIKCNRHFQGFFATDYTFPTNAWTHFSNILETNRTFFSEEDKVNFVQDAFLLAYKGLVDYTAPLAIMSSLVRTNITEFVQWRAFEWHWETLATLVDYLPVTLPSFQNFAVEQILSHGTTLENILEPTEDHKTKLIKSLQFSLLCRMNHPAAIANASELFQSIPTEYFNNTDVDTGIGADFLSTVYTYHIKNSANDNDWNTMFNYYKIAISPQEQTRALVAISSTNNQTRLNQLLSDGLAGGTDTIKQQDYFAMMGYMSQHPVGRETVWEFYRTNYERLVETFTLENNRFGRVILSITRSFENQTYLGQMQDLFAKYPDAGVGAAARKQALDQVHMNIEWIRTREENLRNALNTQY